MLYTSRGYEGYYTVCVFQRPAFVLIDMSHSLERIDSLCGEKQTGSVHGRSIADREHAKSHKTVI